MNVANQTYWTRLAFEIRAYDESIPILITDLRPLAEMADNYHHLPRLSAIDKYAHLIASAPDLLESLKAMTEAFTAGDSAQQTVRIAALEAIAKATGETL